MYIGHLSKKLILFLFVISSIVSCKRSLPSEDIPKMEFSFSSAMETNLDANRRRALLGSQEESTISGKLEGKILFDKDRVQVIYSKEKVELEPSKVLKVFKNDDGYSYYTNHGKFTYYNNPLKYVMLSNKKMIVTYHR